MSRKVPIGVLLSGGGTNLQAIIDAIEKDRLDADIRTVVSNRENAYGLTRARNHGIPTTVIDHRGHASREAYDRVVVEHLKEQGVELVVLAGFMRLLSPFFVQSFPDRIMNIHPALSPSFAGLHGQRQAFEYGVRFAGCTVHFVSEGCDEGPVIIQAVVPVLPDDTEGHPRPAHPCPGALHLSPRHPALQRRQAGDRRQKGEGDRGGCR